MKKLFTILLSSILTMAAVCSCGPKEDPEIAVSGVSVSQSTLTLEVGGSTNLTATVSPSNATNKSVTWSSSNQAVATVNNGTVTAVSPGTATITAMAGGKSGTCSVTVAKKPIAVSSLTLDQTEVSLTEEESVTLTATVSPSYVDDKNVTWESSDNTIATVEGGKITALKAGEVTIIAKVGGKEATCKVTIEPNEESRIKAALMEIYNAMDGPNWKNAENWGTNASLKSWSGVEWNKQKHELRLYFIEQGLKGEFPDCFDALSSCVKFWLQNEPGVTGTLPPSFSKLGRLEVLVIERTSMTSLPDIFSGMPLGFVAINLNTLMDGPLPESLGESDRLMGEDLVEGIYFPKLDCSGNGFTGVIPESWLRLGTHFSIQNHKFSGLIPEYFYTTDNPGYWINLFINSGVPADDLDYRKSDPFIVMDRDIPGYWFDKDINDAITGKPIHYKEIVSKNKATVVFKWASWCGFSAALLPQLKRMQEKYHDAGLEVIARPAWGDLEGEKMLKDYVLSNGYDIWYNFSTAGKELHEEYALGSYGTPFANVIDSNGNIIFSCSPDVVDRSQDRFGHVAFNDLIPFLEDIFGPLEDEDEYSSTDYSKDGDVITLQKATVGKGINVVFMGDAYTDRDMVNGGLYENHMRQSMEELFQIEPYKTFRDRFNVYAVKVVSKNGRTGTGCSTALGTYCAGTTVSISEASDEKALEYALMVPDIKDKKNLLIGVMINSNGLMGITSMKESLQTGIAYYSSVGNSSMGYGPLIRHEAGGHGFAFLADEYSTDFGSPSQELVKEYMRLYDRYGWYSNIDFTADPAKVKWSAFLSDERYANETGVFEGAGGPYSEGIYRPSDDSMMNHNVEYYNAPSRWAIYKRIMELSGEEASFEKFLEYDAVNRSKKQSSAPGTRSATGWVPGAPPIVVP